jgi:hypothetical protein
MTSSGRGVEKRAAFANADGGLRFAHPRYGFTIRADSTNEKGNVSDER